MSGDSVGSDAVREALAHEVIETAIGMGEQGVNNGTSGNVSARFGDSMLITPSGADYGSLTSDDIVTMDMDGSWSAGNNQVPSSEWRFHLDIMRARPDVTAVVHAHPVSATALSAHRVGIKQFHYMVAVAGGNDIRCASYATFGTPELSVNVLEALADRKACLLANHGMVAVGASLAGALGLAVEVEVLAAQYLAACALGEPVLLTDGEMAEVHAKMSQGRGYGSYSPPLEA